MIRLTKLNGTPMVLNSDLIKTAEASPDTMLTLINGEKLIVREPIDELVEAILVYRAKLLTNVAQRLPDIGKLVRAASLTSTDFMNRSDESTKTQQQQPGRSI